MNHEPHSEKKRLIKLPECIGMCAVTSLIETGAVVRQSTHIIVYIYEKNTTEIYVSQQRNLCNSAINQIHFHWTFKSIKQSPIDNGHSTLNNVKKSLIILIETLES